MFPRLCACYDVTVAARPGRYLAAMIAYAAIGVLAAATLDDWRFRAGVLILLAGLALKTWIAERTRS
jgi:hypothetical protein